MIQFNITRNNLVINSTGFLTKNNQNIFIYFDDSWSQLKKTITFLTKKKSHTIELTESKCNIPDCFFQDINENLFFNIQGQNDNGVIIFSIYHNLGKIGTDITTIQNNEQQSTIITSQDIYDFIESKINEQIDLKIKDKEDKDNKIQLISSESTNIQYPSAQATYTAIQDAINEAIIQILNTEYPA